MWNIVGEDRGGFKALRDGGCAGRGIVAASPLKNAARHKGPRVQEEGSMLRRIIDNNNPGQAE